MKLFRFAIILALVLTLCACSAKNNDLPQDKTQSTAETTLAPTTEPVTTVAYSFKDVQAEDMPFVSAACAVGAMEGVSEKEFDASSTLNYEDAAKIAQNMGFHEHEILENKNLNERITLGEFLTLLAEIRNVDTPDLEVKRLGIDAQYHAYNGSLIAALANKGVIMPNDGGIVYTEQSVTRLDAAKIIASLIRPDLAAEPYQITLCDDPSPVTSLEIVALDNPDFSKGLYIGQSTWLKAELKPSSARSHIIWESDDPETVTVDSFGRITMLREGRATVTATAYNGIKTKITVKSRSAAPELSYTLNSKGDGYLVSGCSNYAYAAVIPAEYQGLAVKGIVEGTFKNCQNLSMFIVDANNEYLRAEDGVLFSGNTLLCYPQAKIYPNYYNVPKGIEEIAAYAFYGLQGEYFGLSSITLPDGVERIGDYAFAHPNSHYFVMLPDSIEKIGKNILEGDTYGVVFYGSRNTAMDKYADEHQYIYGVATPQEGKVQTVVSNPPSYDLPAENNRYVGETVNVSFTAGIYDPFAMSSHFSVHIFCELNDYMKQDCEVRASYVNAWPDYAPDITGRSQAGGAVTTGLYGAGNTDKEAVLRAYDRMGNLIGVQEISGTFSFCFDDACYLGFEGGENITYTVVPFEPVFVSTAGEAVASAESWYRLSNGNIFNIFIIQYPQSYYSLNFPSYLNIVSHMELDSANRNQELLSSSENFMLLSFFTRDFGMIENISEYSISILGMETLLDNSDIKVNVASSLKRADNFGKRTADLWADMKDFFIGKYHPEDIEIQKLTITGNGYGTPTSSYVELTGGSEICLDDYTIAEFEITALVHEMTHAIDQSCTAFTYVTPSTWKEGRAEYTTEKYLEHIGSSITVYHNPNYDWSFLTEADKADFFEYYCFGANRYTEYDVGYFFMKYLCDTYGDEVMAKITENLNKITDWGESDFDRQDAKKFKTCVEDATEVGVFQNFVRDVVEK